MVFELPTERPDAPVRVSLRAGTTTVAAAEGNYVFDAAGRLVTASCGEAFYKRGLGHRVLEKRRAAGRGWRYRDLEAPEKARLVEQARAAVAAVAARLRANAQNDAPNSAPDGLAERLARIAAWDAAAYEADARRFHAVYRPVGILPPDQYLSVVLQATEGCHYNRCTFCTFYRDVPFHAKDEAAFRAHVAAVRAFLGDGLSMRRTVFLADANALALSRRRLVPLFHVVRDAFAVAPAGLSGAALTAWLEAHPGGVAGVYSFLDAFTGNRITADAFAELAALGLRRVYIGMESGHVPLLRFLDKPSLPDDVAAVVAAARAGGVNVGVIVMIGVGGDRYDAAHTEDTAAVLSGLGLTAGDLVYLSPFVEQPGSAYVERAREAGIRALTAGEQAAQEARLRAALRLPPGVRMAAYALPEFIY